MAGVLLILAANLLTAIVDIRKGLPRRVGLFCALNEYFCILWINGVQEGLVCGKLFSGVNSTKYDKDLRRIQL